jgi:hypothetical protein
MSYSHCNELSGPMWIASYDERDVGWKKDNCHRT